ncbi:MAG: hypothetical protein ACKOC5_11145 [Chloroflexota bacterium]
MIAPRSSRELWLALAAILLLTGAYAGLVFYWRAVPPAGELVGHTFGVVGFVLMLLTETLYSLRKRSRSARWGRMSSWLKLHIFTGLVGPYLVLLHSAWKFNGLAGVTTWLTAAVVLSGFIGRYLYTAIPRTAEGLEAENSAIESEIAAIQARLAHPDPAQARRLPALRRRQAQLQRQMQTRAAARRLLSTWHTVHIPLGVALFSAAFIHMIAALYYATFLH